MPVNPGRIKKMMEEHSGESSYDDKVAEAYRTGDFDFTYSSPSADPLIDVALRIAIPGSIIASIYLIGKFSVNGAGYGKLMADYKKSRKEWESNHPAYKKSSWRFWKK